MTIAPFERMLSQIKQNCLIYNKLPYKTSLIVILGLMSTVIIKFLIFCFSCVRKSPYFCSYKVLESARKVLNFYIKLVIHGQ